MEYKICTHIYDDGHTCGCGSAAAKDRDYCTYHPVIVHDSPHTVYSRHQQKSPPR